MEADWIETAQQAARVAGRILQDWRTRFTVREKSGRGDLVTEADFASQQAILQLLAARFPDHGCLGEEGLQKVVPHSPFRWVIDPLDGTANYVHGFPYYAVSIALEHAGELVVGVIYDPTRDEMFVAARGRGATLNGQRLTTSGVGELREAMLMASFPHGVHRQSPAIQRFLRVLPHAQTIQRTGSACLNLASVAAGRIDGFWSTSLKPWDMAAGVLLVREAGGIVTQVAGGAFELEVADLVASGSQRLHQQLVEHLRGSPER